MPKSKDFSVHDAVSFKHQGKDICGYVQRKSHKTALVVTSQGLKFRVPWGVLSLLDHTFRQRLLVAEDYLKACFLPGDEVIFQFRGVDKRGEILQLNSERVLITTNHDGHVRVPYQLLELPQGQGIIAARKRRLHEILEKAVSLMTKYGLDRWIFRFDLASSRGGICKYDHKLIALSNIYSLTSSESEIMNTILHEIAHALVGPQHNHDATWLTKAKSIGCTGEVTIGREGVKTRYIQSCTYCGWVRRVQRRRFNTVCVQCGGPISHRTYTNKAWREIASASQVYPH